MKSLMTIRWVLLLCFAFMSIRSDAQTELRKIKKEIPAKGIKSVEASSFSDRLFVYRTKLDTGLWDTQSKKVIFTHFKEASPTPFSSNWITYSTASEYGVYDLVEMKNLVNSNEHFWLTLSMDSNLVNVIGKEIIGFLDLKRNAGYCANFFSAADSTFFDEREEFPKCSYSSESNEISYSYGGVVEDEDGEIVGYEDFITIYYKDGYIWESGRVFDLHTGKLIAENMNGAHKWKDYFETYSTAGTSYYDEHFNLIFKNIKYDKYGIDHFQFFADSAINSVEFIGNKYIYLCKMGSQQRFYSTLDMEPGSLVYDHTFRIGNDFIQKGHSFFTVKEGSGYGVYNTVYGEELEPKYNLIEKRIFPDGSYWYRADGELHSVKRHYTDSAIVKPWNSTFEKTSMVINHMGVTGNKFVLSMRSTSADTHDSEFYTATDFDKGSGVINLKDTTWLIQPRYHTITPYKGHYVAMKIGSSYPNASWLQTTIFDKDFKPITDRKFGVAFIYNDMLIMRDGISDNYISYDVENNKVDRALGAWTELGGDFKLVDGYLIIGDNNYTRSKELVGMDICDIISPKGDLVRVPGYQGRNAKRGSLKRFRFYEMLSEELVIIERIKKDEPTDVNLHELKTDAYALFDLRSRKIISPWCERIDSTYEGDDIYYLEKRGDGDEQLTIPIKEIRARFVK